MNTNNSTISSKTYVPFKTAGVERVRIDQSGNIGINTTAPSAVLDINGNTKMRGQLDISGNNIINIGSLGIGTATPAFALDISGASKFRDTLDLSTNNITNANQISATTNLVLQPTTGNVGIGTSAPANKLHINGTLQVDTGDIKLQWGGNKRKLASEFSDTYRNGLLFKESRELQLFSCGESGDGGIISFFTRAATSANSDDYGTERMRITSDGRIGIGTSAPASLLDVNGETKIRGALDLSTNNITNANQISATTNLVLQPTTGNVGIGTSAPASLLDVNGAAKIRGVLDLSSNNITNANQISATTNLVLQPTTGNVGIGTSVPSQILQVGNGGRLRISNDITDYTLIGTKETDDASNTRIVLSGYDRTGQTGGIEYIATNTGVHVFRTSTSGSERMRITSTGRIGIGTTTPTCPLYVAGGNYQTGSIYGGKYGRDGYNNAELTNTNLVTAIFDYWIAASGLEATSDKRIKHNITQIEKDNALNILRELNPVRYEYKENAIHGTYYGFIAQEIENILKTSVKYNRNFIPNIQSFADYTKIANNKYNIKCQNPITFESKNPLPYTIRVYYDDNYSSDTATIIEIISSNEFIIETTPDISFNKCYIYGQEVDDYRTLVYDHIFTVATAALQEIDRQQQADKARIAELEQEVATQKSTIATILERLEKIETKSQ